MRNYYLINEDFFDDVDTNEIVDTEIEDNINDINNANYTHYFHIYFNIPIMCGRDYEKYVKQYTSRITTAIQITNRIFSLFSAIIDCSSIEISKDRLPMCDKEVKMGDYSIKYSSSIHSRKHAHGLAFNPDGIIINIKAVCNFRTARQIERFFDLFFNKISESKTWIGVGSIIIEKLNFDINKYKSKLKEPISIFNSVEWNRKDWRQKRYDIAQMLDVLAKPGVYGQFLHKYKTDDADIIIKSKRGAEVHLCEEDNVYINPVRVQNIIFYETGIGAEAVSCKYDFDNKHVTETTYIADYLDGINLDDMCTKAVQQVTSRKSVFDMYVIKFDNYTIGGKSHIGIYFIFRDTFVYKDKEYILTFYSESLDYTDIEGSAYCLNMMKSAGYSEENALDERKIGVFYRDDIKIKIIDKAKELMLAE